MWRAGFGNVGGDGLQISGHGLVVVTGQGIEVAVFALAAAEGNMHINAQGLLAAPIQKSHDYLQGGCEMVY